MSLLWTIPVLAVVAGAAVALVQLRSLTNAAGELGDALRRLDEVRGEIAEVRSRGAACRSQVEDMTARRR